MPAIFSLFFLLFSAFALSVVFDQDAVEMLPFTSFAVILYLYIFYCANLFPWGICTLYLLLALLLAYAVYTSIKKKRNVVNKLTPAFVVFLCVCIFFFLYTKDNYSVLWDELRVWSAMPKAIYETGKLQLGAESLIFDSPGFNMQTYPPALALFTNYFLAFAPTFAESYIFFAYAVFVSSISVNVFRHLRWKDWWFIPFIAIFVIYAPILLTKHGGDHSYFYESLFIDPVLGFAAGYSFFLASADPLRTRFSRLQFSLSLAVLVIIKDSGIMFAILSLLCAVSIKCFERKSSLKVIFQGMRLPLCLILLSYFPWKLLLSFFNSQGHLSLHLDLFTTDLLRILFEVITREPIIPLRVINISFLGYCLALFAVCFIAEILFKPHSKSNNLIVFVSLFIAIVLFACGYLMVFPSIDSYALMVSLSYKRYFTTLCAMLFIFCSLRYFCVVYDVIKPGHIAAKSTILLFSILLLLRFGPTLSYWERDYTEDLAELITPAQSAKEQILLQIPVDDAAEPKNIYLLIAEREPEKIHHRIYFELIGSGIHIENFYNDTDMYYGTSASPYSVEETAEKWYARLQDEGYDYIYVYSTNDTFNQAFAHLGLEEPIPGTAYPVKH